MSQSKIKEKKKIQFTFPTYEESNEERIRFMREASKKAGVPNDLIESQITTIARIPWDACYAWLKKKCKA